MAFIDAIFGSPGRNARVDLQAAADRANRSIRERERESIGTRREFLDRSLGFLEGDIQAGGQARNQLAALLGLQGAGAERAAVGAIETTPSFDRVTQAGIDALDRSAAARGQLFSGGQLREVGDFAARREDEFLQRRRNELMNILGLGSGAERVGAGLTSGAGSEIANTQFGTGQLLANNAIGLGNAMAQTRNVPINNLLGLLGGAAGVARGFA